MRQLKRLALVVVMLFVAAVPLRAGDPAPVIKALPADTKIFILIPKLSALTEKYNLLAGQLGLPPGMDPLAMLKTQLGMMQGVDDNGAGAVALTFVPIPDADKPHIEHAPKSPKPGAEGPSPDEPTGLAFVPVTDYKAFLGNFGENLDAAGVATIQIEGKQNFIKSADKYAVIGEKKEEVEAYKAPADNGLIAASGAIGGSVLSTSDALVYVDMAKLGPALRPQLKKAMDEAVNGLKNNPDAMTGMAIAWLDIYRRVIDNVLADGQSVILGIDVSNDGVGMSFSGQFKPGSPLATTFGTAPSAPLSLNRLPSRPYLFATTMNLKALPLKQWMKALGDATPADQPIGKIIKDSAATMDLVGDEVQQAFYAPDFAGGAPPTFNNSVAVYPTDKPAELLKANRETFKKMDGLKLDEKSGMAYKAGVQENIMQVAGLNVDKFSIKLDLGPTPPPGIAGNPVASMLLMQDMGGLMVATDKAVILAAGADAIQLKAAIESSDGSGKMDADPGIVNVRKNLLPNRVMEMFIGIDTAVKLVKNFAPAYVPDLPASLPPIAVSTSVAAGGAGNRLFVPMAVIVGVKKAIDKAQHADEFAVPDAEPAPDKAGPAGGKPAPAAADPNVATLSDAAFEADVLKSDKPVLVSFWGDWAPERKVQDPVVSQIAEQFKGKIKVGKLDIDKNPKTTDKYDVQQIPTLLIIKGGQVVQKFPGGAKKEALEAAIQKAIAP